MTKKNKHPAGYFEKILVFDCETTGLTLNNADPSIGHQCVSWGMIVADAKTLKPIEELYVEIKWNKESKELRKKDPTYGKAAEKIHGLTFTYLEKNGVSEEEALVQILTLILKYWGPSSNIRTMGHNGPTFDLPFFRSLLRRHDFKLKFGNRHIDTSSVGFITVGSFTSNALFETMGMAERGEHNALDDAHQALESMRRIRLFWDKKVQLNAYD